MLADPAVDVVVVGSSTDVHEAHVLACVAAGKAILCEKPIADSLDGARRCLDAARAASVIAAIGFNRRFDVHHRAVFDRIRAGEIGAVENVHIVSRSSGGLAARGRASRRRHAAREGNASLRPRPLDDGTEPVEVYAAGGCLIDPGHAAYGDVDTAALTLRFASGALATFAFSRRTSYGFDEMIEVFGSNGHAAIGPAAAARSSRSTRATDRRRRHLRRWYERFAPTYVAELDAVIEAVRGPRCRPASKTACGRRRSPKPRVHRWCSDGRWRIENLWQ